MAYSVEDARTDAYLLCLIMLKPSEMATPAADAYMHKVAGQLYTLYIRFPEHSQPKRREPLMRI